MLHSGVFLDVCECSQRCVGVAEHTALGHSGVGHWSLRELLAAESAW